LDYPVEAQPTNPKSKIKNPKSERVMAKKTETASSGTIKIQYYKSTIGYSKKQKEIVRQLGITKLNQTVERPDNPAMRGIVAKVPHLLRIVE
jgi:large subunit ribosomal protein L30